MEKKFIYEAPDVEQILLKLEQGILTVSETGIQNIEGDDVVDDSSLWS